MANIDEATVLITGATDGLGRRVARDLARGPARLCRALGIHGSHNGVDLSSGELTLSPGEPVSAVSTGPRVGLRGAPDRPWRFWITGDPCVSTYRPAAPLGRRRTQAGPGFGVTGERR